jgi:hypothetical protein
MDVDRDFLPGIDWLSRGTWFHAQAPAGGDTDRYWQAWHVPTGARLVVMFALGGGGGGGRGFSGAAGTARGGGGAGGCAGHSWAVVPAHVLPPTLYVFVGRGGEGAVSGGSSATSGQVSIIGTEPTGSNNLKRILQSGTGANAGNGTGAAGGAGGGIGSATTWTLSCWGMSDEADGNSGVAGGAPGSAGVSATALAGNRDHPLAPGGGGGGVSAGGVEGAGGSVLAAGPVALLAGGAAGGGQGLAGHWSWRPFYGTGGSGGGASNTGTGGHGGDGGFGCGGGGGGGGVTGGNGGRGGDGLVWLCAI